MTLAVNRNRFVGIRHGALSPAGFTVGVNGSPLRLKCGVVVAGDVHSRGMSGISRGLRCWPEVETGLLFSCLSTNVSRTGSAEAFLYEDYLVLVCESIITDNGRMLMLVAAFARLI